VGSAIRAEDVGGAASLVSALPGVRALLLGLQRELGSQGSVVLEGRDIGTVVFPEAEVKIFLTASIEARAKRRAEELKAKGQSVDFNQVKEEMARRDRQDSTRAIAPLKQAADALLVDTSGMPIDSVLDRLESIVRDAE
jgi:cytidylate kinase